MDDGAGLPQLLTPAQVAQELGFCRDWVYHLLRTNALPGVKLGGRTWRIRRDILEAILNGEIQIGDRAS